MILSIYVYSVYWFSFGLNTLMRHLISFLLGYLHLNGRYSFFPNLKIINCATIDTNVFVIHVIVMVTQFEIHISNLLSNRYSEIYHNHVAISHCLLKCNFIFGNTLYALCQQLRCKSLPKMLYKICDLFGINGIYETYLGFTQLNFTLCKASISQILCNWQEIESLELDLWTNSRVELILIMIYINRSQITRLRFFHT